MVRWFTEEAIQEVIDRVATIAAEEIDKGKVEDLGQQDRSQESGIKGKQQITIDKMEGYVNLVNALRIGTVEISTAVVEGLTVVEDEYVQTGDAPLEVSGDVAEATMRRASRRNYIDSIVE